MYLAELHIYEFRKLKAATIQFQPGLNVIVGPNNVGKTAVVDALRALLAGPDEPFLRLSDDDIHAPKGGARAGAITFKYVFRDLSADDEADFLAGLRPALDGKMEATVGVTYGDPDQAGRLRVRRWCGDHDDVPLTPDMLENLRGVYLPPLRDAAQGLRPSRTSQLARLIQLLSDQSGRDAIDAALAKLDDDLKKHAPLVTTEKSIVDRHAAMLGPQLIQTLAIGLSVSDFQRLAARLSLLVDDFEIEMNGLGFNNLIFMAVVLSELAKNPDAAFRGLIIEEPEAHLHSQLQSVLLRYLSAIPIGKDEKPVQVFVTSHSPHFASIARLDCLSCLFDANAGIETFFPRQLKFQPGKKEKLERYLDVTRAEIFFARRVIFVEGAAELLLVNVLAEKGGFNLRHHAVSLISVEGLNFDSFMPLFGEAALKLPVAVVTDADPVNTPAEGEEAVPVYPAAGDPITVSANTASMKKLEDKYMKVFHGAKTLEYDLALIPEMRPLMLEALKELHPVVGGMLETAVAAARTDAEKAKVLFSGMFERPSNNVQKGRFAQTLAARIAATKVPIPVPGYILAAVRHACQITEGP